jgi:hypothetical protein
MIKFTATIAKITAVATIVATFVIPANVFAAEIAPVSTSVGPWVVTTLAKDAGATSVEAYKVDKNLVAWTEINGSQRMLYAYDGTQIRLLAAFDKSDWKDDGNGFYDAVQGNFDVADGLVVWTMSDGNDREIYSFDGNTVKKVSDNTYDDRHPITSAGRIAWISQPSENEYNLMVHDQYGTRRVAAWPVTDYAFSGSNLFWLDTAPGENWMHVFVNGGLATSVIGQGDDRPMTKYFFTDGKGNAAWEYSTKNWTDDHRVVYVSVGGASALAVNHSEVPPAVTRVEDMNDGQVMMNVTNLLDTDLPFDTALLQITNPYMQSAISTAGVASKVRYMDDGYVRMRDPGANSGLVFDSNDGYQDFITLDPIILDRFDADGDAAAGALIGGGLATRVDGQTVTIPSTVETASLMVKNGDVAWIEGAPGSQTLKFATTPVLVSAAESAKSVIGHLVKSSGSPTVYFAAQDGSRYAFVGSGTYFSWFDDFATVQTISNAAIAQMPLGGDVLYKPGSRLLKVASSPKIYQIGNDGSVHWIESEDILVSAYGSHWQQQVTVISATDLADYPQGAPIPDQLSYIVALAK